MHPRSACRISAPSSARIPHTTSFSCRTCAREHRLVQRRPKEMPRAFAEEVARLLGVSVHRVPSARLERLYLAGLPAAGVAHVIATTPEVR